MCVSTLSLGPFKSLPGRLQTCVQVLAGVSSSVTAVAGICWKSFLTNIAGIYFFIYSDTEELQGFFEGQCKSVVACPDE